MKKSQIKQNSYHHGSTTACFHDSTCIKTCLITQTYCEKLDDLHWKSWMSKIIVVLVRHLVINFLWKSFIITWSLQALQIWSRHRDLCPVCSTYNSCYLSLWVPTRIIRGRLRCQYFFHKKQNFLWYTLPQMKTIDISHWLDKSSSSYLKRERMKKKRYYYDISLCYVYMSILFAKAWCIYHR